MPLSLSLSLPLISISSLLSFFRGRCILGVESRVLHEVKQALFGGYIHDSLLNFDRALLNCLCRIPTHDC